MEGALRWRSDACGGRVDTMRYKVASGADPYTTFALNDCGETIAAATQAGDIVLLGVHSRRLALKIKPDWTARDSRAIGVVSLEKGREVDARLREQSPSKDIHISYSTIVSLCFVSDDRFLVAVNQQSVVKIFDLLAVDVSLLPSSTGVFLDGLGKVAKTTSLHDDAITPVASDHALRASTCYAYDIVRQKMSGDAEGSNGDRIHRVETSGTSQPGSCSVLNISHHFNPDGEEMRVVDVLALICDAHSSTGLAERGPYSSANGCLYFARYVCRSHSDVAVLVNSQRLDVLNGYAIINAFSVARVGHERLSTDSNHQKNGIIQPRCIRKSVTANELYPARRATPGAAFLVVAGSVDGLLAVSRLLVDAVSSLADAEKGRCDVTGERKWKVRDETPILSVEFRGDLSALMWIAADGVLGVMSVDRSCRGEGARCKLPNNAQGRKAGERSGEGAEHTMALRSSKRRQKGASSEGLCDGEGDAVSSTAEFAGEERSTKGQEGVEMLSSVFVAKYNCQGTLIASADGVQALEDAIAISDAEWRSQVAANRRGGVQCMIHACFDETGDAVQRIVTIPHGDANSMAFVRWDLPPAHHADVAEDREGDAAFLSLSVVSWPDKAPGTSAIRGASGPELGSMVGQTLKAVRWRAGSRCVVGLTNWKSPTAGHSAAGCEAHSSSAGSSKGPAAARSNNLIFFVASWSSGWSHIVAQFDAVESNVLFRERVGEFDNLRWADPHDSKSHRFREAEVRATCTAIATHVPVKAVTGSDEGRVIQKLPAMMADSLSPWFVSLQTARRITSREREYRFWTPTAAAKRLTDNQLLPAPGEDVESSCTCGDADSAQSETTTSASSCSWCESTWLAMEKKETLGAAIRNAAVRLAETRTGS